VVHLARCTTQDLYNTDTSYLNNTVTILAFSQSMSFRSADLPWVDMYICLSLLNPCLHNGETRYRTQQMMLLTSQYSELAH